MTNPPPTSMANIGRTRLWVAVENSIDARTVDRLAQLFDLTVVGRTLKQGHAVSQDPTAEVKLKEFGGNRVIFAFRLLIELIARHRDVEVVLVQGYGVVALAANIAGRLTRIPTVMLVLSPAEEYYRCRPGGGVSGKPFRRREFFALQLVARINGLVGMKYITVSNYLADVVRSHETKCPIYVCPIYGVDKNVFRPTDLTKRQLRRDLGLPQNGSLIFFSSRIAPEKDVDTLLRSFAMLLESGRDIWLLNASGGYREIVDRASRYAFRDRLIALPALDPRHELASYYQAADVCVQASKAEGLGFSPLEALACGIPVVAACVGGLRETIIDGSTGWTYPPGNASALASALTSALDQPDEAARRAKRGATLVRACYDSELVFSYLADLLISDS